MVCINNQQLLTILLRKLCAFITILSKYCILDFKIILVPITLTTYHRDTLDDDS